MALTPFRNKWSYQLIADEEQAFTLEDNALANTKTIYNPVLRFHNIGDEAATLKITYTLNLGSQTDDPLNSGTYTNTVVDETVSAGAFRDYDFGGIHLSNDTTYVITHTVTIKNIGASTHVFHTLLTGQTETQAQLPQGLGIVRGSSN